MTSTMRSSGGFGTMGSTSSSAWSGAGTLQRTNNPFTSGAHKPLKSTASKQASTRKPAESEVEIMRKQAEDAADWGSLHGVERFVHPRTGRELPEVVHFRPGRCELLDDGRATSQVRGLLYYLATGGSEEYVNPADTDAQLQVMKSKEETLRKMVQEEREQALDMESMLLLLQIQDSRTTENMIAMVRAARDHLEGCLQLEDQLSAEETLWEPNEPRIDEMRRAVQTLSCLVDSKAADAENLDTLLRHQSILRTGLQTKRSRVKQAEAELGRLRVAVLYLESRGLVQVQTSGWQRGRGEDVLSLAPKYSWSNYTWESLSSPDHPEQSPGGAWFTVTLPLGLWIIPSHYALRHGDDCVPYAPAVRHDSNASTWEGTLHKTIAPSAPPVTSWGSTTRAMRAYSPNALVDWELWGAEERDGAEWLLLREHKGDAALHAPFGEAVWEVHGDDEREVDARKRRRFVQFKVIMTGPTANGGHGLFCSGFDVFGQVGLEKEKKPPPQAPRGLKYKFDNELYACDEFPIIPNECVVLGTNDQDCPMTFTVHPQLPPGLVVDPKTGTMCGKLVLEDMGPWQSKVLKGTRMGFTVTCRNCVGEARTRVTFTMITPPRFFRYAHSEVTYEINDANMAFSKEMLAAAEADGWQRHPFEPIDLAREVEANTITAECDLGSNFSWPEDVPLPTVGGRQVQWTGRLSWPQYELVSALPVGLELDTWTARISGVPTREESGTFEVRCVNPAGGVSAAVKMSVVVPPRGFEYDKAECVLVYMQDIGIKTCRCEQGTPPLRFEARQLPRGLEINTTDGSITGVASQLDQSFIKYTVRVANDVGLAQTELKLLCALPMDQISEAERIVNLDVEARVGQKVRGTPGFITSRASTGLADPSATFARHPDDGNRFRSLESKSRALGWGRDPREMHVAAAGRGTVTQVLLDGNACQVRWDNTGLVRVYRTGKDGEYELQLWGSSRRLVEAWEALEETEQAALATDDDVLEAQVDAYLAEYRAGGRWQSRELTKLGLFDRELHTWLSSTAPLPFGYKERALLQRLILELSNPSDSDDEDAASDSTFNPASKFSRELWNCLHIRDSRVGLAIDWDPYIGFVEFVQHSRAVQAASKPPRPALAAPRPQTPGRKGKTAAEPGETWEMSAGERRCVLVWLLVDKKLRLALQDSVGEGWTAEAAVRLVRTETRRLGKMDFLRGMRELSAGLHLRLSDSTIHLLFRQADGDKDGYIALPDAVKAFRDSRRLTRWEKLRRKEVNVRGGAGAACGQAGLNVTWSDLVERVHTRPVSLTLHSAADIHDIIEAKIYAAVAPVERKAKRALARVVQGSAGGGGDASSMAGMRQWADFGAAAQAEDRDTEQEASALGQPAHVGGLQETEVHEEEHELLT